MVTSRPDRLIDGWFPAALADGYEPTSGETYEYNCIAWAASDVSIPWWPTIAPGAYWPPGVNPEHTLKAFVQAYATLGYKKCGMNKSLQRRYEKIAIYVDRDGKPTHAARQLASGVWTSKLGQYRDIHHSTPAGLEDVPGRAQMPDDYGKVAVYMRRKRKPEHLCLVVPGIKDVRPPNEPSFLVNLIRRFFGT